MEKPAGLDTHFAKQGRENKRNPVNPNSPTEREYLRQFAACPGMFIGFTTVRGVTCFLDGYNYAARRSGGQGLDGFRDWRLANRLRRDSSLAWFGVIEQIALPEWDYATDLTPEHEIRILETLFDLLDEFLAERESAGRA